MFDFIVGFVKFIWNLFKKSINKDVNKDISDLQKDFSDLKHQVQTLELELLRVWGQIGQIQHLHTGVQLRIESMSQEFGRYKQKTDDELRSIQQFLQALTADGADVLSRVDALLKEGVESELLKKTLLEQREKVVSINKKAKNNLTRTTNELNKRNVA
jgi:chromosome segregation ATPase